MDANKRRALDRALKQIQEIDSVAYQRPPLSVVMSGEQDFPPDGLFGELEVMFGREVKIEWRKVASVKRTNNTGDITDAPRDFIDYGAARYYEDAAERGARTGD